jgi:small subunit ribosomal protein S13
MKDFKTFESFIEINKKKNLNTSLRKVHGINLKNLKKIVLLNGWSNCPDSKVSRNTFITLKDQVDFFFSLEKNKVFNNVERKKKIKSYSGMRHILRLPVRGQRTHTNSKTSRSNIKKEL